MTASRSRWGIYAALCASAVLVLGAYLLATHGARTPLAEASTESALLAQVAARDSDNDGLPDWEESLYGTDPHNPDTRGLGMTDGEAVNRGLVVPRAVVPDPANSTSATSTESAPTTLTDIFLRNFTTLYLSAKEQASGATLTSAQTSQLADQAVNNLLDNLTLATSPRTAADLTVSGSGPNALRGYAAAAEVVFLAHKSTATTSEMRYFRSAVDGNSGATTQLSAIAASYRDDAAGLLVLPVPQELQGADLALINALRHLSDIIDDLARVTDDPLASMLALRLYPSAAANLAHAFVTFADAYDGANITLSPQEPGATFLTEMKSARAYATSTTP